MAIFWEWRRLFRQRMRSISPKTPLSYQQWSKRRLIISFVLFFAGWKAAGVALNDMLLWTTDENGKGRMLTPAEGKQRRIEMEMSRDKKAQMPTLAKGFDLDD